MTSVELKEMNGGKIDDKAFVEDLAIPLRFEWTDGVVGDVCPTDDKDSQWSLNFKRSVISALQNAMDSLEDSEPVLTVDAAGECWTNYEAKSNGRVEWTRDLNQCSERQGGMVATYGLRYTNPMSDVNTIPLTEGTQRCEQTADTGKKIVRQTTCTETMTFMPSKLAEGAVKVNTESKMEIKFVSESGSMTESAAPQYISDLKFDHSYVPAALDGNVQEAEQIISEMCSTESVDEKSARRMSDLVDALRGLTKEEIEQVCNKVSCETGKMILHNILPDVGTTAASRFIVEMVKQNRPSSSIVREDWMAALGQIHMPAEDILDEAARIVTTDDEMTVTGRAYLGVGSALNNFCMKNKDCNEKTQVKAAVKRFQGLLSVCQSGSGMDRKAMYALRALANAGPAVNDDAWMAVKACATNKRMSNEIRESAITATRRVPCTDESSEMGQMFRDIVKDSSDDSEFRSYAIIAAMRCPCIGDVDAIREAINQPESAEKFGPFAVSFIGRLEEAPTSAFWADDLRSTIGAVMATEKAAELALKADAMKTGASMHRQKFWRHANAGYMYDVDMIHADRSVVPRAIRFNLTAGLFGTAVNPLELGLRHEGLEQIANEMPAPEELIDNSNGMIPTINTNRLQPILDKLKMNVFVRVFGSEVRYASVDKQVMERLRQRLDERVGADDLMGSEGRHGAELFMDRALSLPTVSGLPLRLAIRGSYRSHVRPSVSPNMERDSNGRITGLSMKADIKAGLSVEVRSSMTAFIGAKQYGVQTTTRMNSRADYSPEFKFAGREVTMKVGLPEETIRTASISNEVTIRRHKTEEPIRIDGGLRTSKRCSPGITGIQVCFETEMPSQWNGIMTPGKVEMSMKKIDPQMKSVEFQLKADHTTSNNRIESVDFKLYAATPDNNQRMFLAAIKASVPNSELEAQLQTPWKKAHLTIKPNGDNIEGELKVGEQSVNDRVYKVVVKRSQSTVTEGNNQYPKRSVEVEVTRNDLSNSILKAKGYLTDMTDSKEVSITVEELNIPNFYTLQGAASLTGELGFNERRGQGFAVKGMIPGREFETEFGFKSQASGNKMTYSHRLHHQSKGTDNENAFDRQIVWDVELTREPSKELYVKSDLRSMEVALLEKLNHKVVFTVNKPTDNDRIMWFHIEAGKGDDKKSFQIASKLHHEFTSANRAIDYELSIAGTNMVDRGFKISTRREWTPKPLVNVDFELRRGDIAVYKVTLYGRRDDIGLGELRFRTLCPFSDFMIEAMGTRDGSTVRHSIRLERNSDLRFNFESAATIEADRRDVDAKIEIMGMNPILIESRGKGSPFNGKYQHDASIAYGARKLLFGGNVNYQPKSDNEGILDLNLYAGTLERMFKQYINWHRVDKIVTLKGMTELGDDLYQLKGQLDLEQRRHSMTIDGPRSSTSFFVGRFEDQRGYEVSVSHSCPGMDAELFSKLSLSPRASSMAGHINYFMAGMEERKTIGYRLGYAADMREGLNLGFTSGVTVNDKEWFANANVTAIPGKQLGLSMGAGDGENFRNKFTIMGSKRDEQENVMRIDLDLEAHSTVMNVPRMRFLTFKRLRFNPETRRLGGYETVVKVTHGYNQMWYSVDLDIMDPKTGATLAINGETPYTERTEVKLAYTASMPTITVGGNIRYGEKLGRVRGLIELTSTERDNVDVSYSFGVYTSKSDSAEITLRGQHQGNMKTRGVSFLTLEVRENAYAINSKWDKENGKTAEIIIRTPHESYRENIIRISVQKEDQHSMELLVKIGERNIRLTGWRRVEGEMKRAEMTLDSNGRIYSFGYSIEMPEEMGSRGERRIRVRIDTPIEGYETSTFLFWFKPTTHGMHGIKTVLGLAEDSQITEQRSQLQIAYQIGEEKKGGIMMSARGQRFDEASAFMREASVIVKLPIADFSVDYESFKRPEKAGGWFMYKSNRFGEWRADFQATGSVESQGDVSLRIRGKRAGSDDEVDISISGNHDLTGQRKEITGMMTSNIEGYDRVRIRAAQYLSDLGDITLETEFLMPGGKKADAKIAFGVTVDEKELSIVLNTPFEQVKNFEFYIRAMKDEEESELEFRLVRNERRYELEMSTEIDGDNVSGNLELKTPFEALKSASGTFSREGRFATGSKTTGEFTVNGNTMVKINSEGQMGKFINTVVQYGSEEYKLIFSKEEGNFELRMPTPYNCIIHYTGEISADDVIKAELKKHHSCSPYSFSGSLVVDLASEQRTLKAEMETPIPYFTNVKVDFGYEFDEIVYQLDGKVPPMSFTLMVDREGKKLNMEGTYDPEEKTSTFMMTVRSVSIKMDNRIGASDGGHINLDIETPVVNIQMRNKREGSWVKPDNMEASLSAAGFDVYSLMGSWDFSNYPSEYTFNADGAVAGKPVQVNVEGEMQGARNWNREVEVKIGSKKHTIKTSMAGTKFSHEYKNSDNKMLKFTAEMTPSEANGMKKANSVYTLEQSGYTSAFNKAEWRTMYAIPASIDIASLPQELRRDAKEVIKSILKNIAWEQTLTVDGEEKYSTDGSLSIVPPASFQDMVGMKVEYKTNRKWSGRSYSMEMMVEKTSASEPTNYLLKVTVGGQKKVDLKGTIKRIDSFKNYGKITAEFEAPKRMSFEIERDGRQAEKKWNANINFDKDADTTGTQWELIAKPSQLRGGDLTLTVKRGDVERLMVEAGFERDTTKKMDARAHFFFKTSNMDKKYGFKETIKVENMEVKQRLEFSALTADIVVDNHLGYEIGKKMFVKSTYDLGSADRKLEIDLKWEGSEIKGTVSLGDKVVNIDGTMTATDRHNYEMDVKVREGESSPVQFTFRKTWSEQSMNRTYHATVKSDKGEIEWNSHRFLSDSVRSRGILVHYTTTAGVSNTVYMFGQINMAEPALKVEMVSDFLSFDGQVEMERMESGRKVINGRLNANGKTATLFFDRNPEEKSFDFQTRRFDGTVLKVHSHIFSTKQGYLEAKYTPNADGKFENLVKLVLNLNPDEFQAKMDYNTKLAEILRSYVQRRAEQMRSIVGLFKQNLPQGYNNIREIMYVQTLVRDFINTMRNARQELREAERAQWKIITQEWYNSPDMKFMFSER